MLAVADKDKRRAVQDSISYYNEIAAHYNRVLLGDASNLPVRQRVKEKLLGLLKSGTVLDFGAGTGLDLHWMTANYQVFFCEPSVAMRAKAIQYNNDSLRSDNIVFLDGAATDFNTWQETLPFPQKADAILSNFGPVNCIPNIGLLFNRLALAIKPGGHCLLLLLDLGFRKRLKWHRRNALLSLLPGRPFEMYLREGPYRQTVYLHTPAAIKKAAAPYFNYCSHEPLGGFGFTLFHLTRK